MTAQQGSPEVLSVGYERRDVEELIDLLCQHGVEILVDVRLNAISRKRGLSKRRLAETAAEAGISYRHEPDLGNPQDNREAFRLGTSEARSRYLRHLRNGALSTYQEVIQLAQRSRVALLCYEREHSQCHRSCILDAAQQDLPGLAIREL